jgi:hypothetical protein
LNSNNNSNILINSLAHSTDFKYMLNSIENDICCATFIFNHTQSSNIYNLFLNYLYQNIKETNGTTTTTTTNNVWRTFKGRLYTRLHDKRIADLDLNGIVNVAYLFNVLIKCFSLSNLTSSQLRLDQIENYFRILNVFVNSKNLLKVLLIFFRLMAF